MKQTDVKPLIERAKMQDTDAFTELMQLYMQDMYKVSLAILMNDEDAADAIQDTILACWEKLGTLREPSFFKTWLTRILIHKCYDIRKRTARTLPLTEEALNQPVTENHDNLLLKEALSTLSEKYRSVMVLFYSEGYHIEEIAKLLSIPKSTVKTRLQRGREKLAAYYGISERKDKK